jgi:hypothetical protein
MITGVWAWQSLVALVASVPVAVLVGAATGGDPRGDAALGAPGAHLLMSWLSREEAGVRAVGVAAIATLSLGAAAGMVPHAALLVSLDHGRRDRRALGALAFARGMRLLPKLACVSVAVTVGQAALVGVALLLARLTEAAANRPLGEARADELALALAAPAVLSAAGLGLLADLARAHVVGARATVSRALGDGVLLLARRPASLVWSWSWRTAASLAPVAVVWVLGDSIGAAARGAPHALGAVAMALAHQTTLWVRVALRASWLAKTLRSVRQPPPT